MNGSNVIETPQDCTHFLKIGFMVLRAGFIPIATSNVLYWLKKERKNIYLLYKQIIKKGFNPCWVQFHAHCLKQLNTIIFKKDIISYPYKFLPTDKIVEIY